MSYEKYKPVISFQMVLLTHRTEINLARNIAYNYCSQQQPTWKVTTVLKGNIC